MVSMSEFLVGRAEISRRDPAHLISAPFSVRKIEVLERESSVDALQFARRPSPRSA
jgi:hypothetical protein